MIDTQASVTILELQVAIVNKEKVVKSLKIVRLPEQLYIITNQDFMRFNPCKSVF